MTEFAWVIEKHGCDRTSPIYWTGHFSPELEWSAPGDHARACRFARFGDAAAVAEYLAFHSPNKEPNQTHGVFEHGWDDSKVELPAHLEPCDICGNVHMPDNVSLKMPEPEINEDRLAQLRYRFWKYLGWKQRNEMLINAGMIPCTTKNPLPQTIEMTVINAAPPKQIRALWSEMMPLLPASKRIECP